MFDRAGPQADWILMGKLLQKLSQCDKTMHSELDLTDHEFDIMDTCMANPSHSDYHSVR